MESTQNQQLMGLFNSRAVFNAFTHEFLSEKFCRKFILDLLHSGVPGCPFCGVPISKDNDFSKFYENRIINCKNCGKKWRATSSSILARSRISYRQLVLLSILREIGCNPKMAAAFLDMKPYLIRHWDRKIGLKRKTHGNFMKSSQNTPPFMAGSFIDFSKKDPVELMELIQSFIKDCLFEDPQAETGAAALYNSFKKWHKTKFSWPPMTQKRFGAIMGKRFMRVKKGTYRYLGIGLIHEFDEK